MRKNFVLSIVVLWVLVLGKYSFAHHAMEYIEMDSYPTAKKGEFVFHLHYDYIVDDKNDPTLNHWEFTPGLSYGIHDRLMVDFHTHFAKFGPGHLAVDLTDSKYTQYATHGPPPFMEACALVLQARLTEEKQLPVDIAVALTYEYPY